MEVRLATLDDIEKIAAIKVDNFQTRYHPSSYIHASLKEVFFNEFRKRWLNRLGQGFHVLLLLDEGQIIGLISYAFATPEAWPRAELNNLFILEKRRRQGLAKQLCRAALERIRAAGYRLAQVWVLEENHAVRRFYEGLGFSLSGELRIDAVVRGGALNELGYKLTLDD